jgi:chromosome segregation ATPase
MGAITWRKAGVYLLVVLPVLGLGGIAVIAQQQQQDASQQPAVDPVAEAARKAREQKKEAPKPKKVYTNDDIATSPAAPAPSATAAPNAEAKENPSGQAKADNPGGEKTEEANKNDEATWRKRFKEAREKLADAEKELDILQREAQKAQVQYYSDPQKALAEQYTRQEVNDKDAKIDAKKQEIQQLKQQISDMEDDLRKSGGEIGWARE